MARAGFPVGVGAARPSPGEGFCWQSGFGGLCLDPRRSEGTPSSQGRGHQCLRGCPQPPSLSPGFSALRPAERLLHQRGGHTAGGGRGGTRPGHRALGLAHGLSAGNTDSPWGSAHSAGSLPVLSAQAAVRARARARAHACAQLCRGCLCVLACTSAGPGAAARARLCSPTRCCYFQLLLIVGTQMVRRHLRTRSKSARGGEGREAG